MDYVPAHGNTNNLADRDHISGARVFDGEDQGKNHHYLFSMWKLTWILIRIWKQISDVAVTTRRLDQLIGLRKVAKQELSRLKRIGETSFAHSLQLIIERDTG